MEKKYTLLILLFVAITLISIIGFYTSYLSFFPDYGKFQLAIHIHFLAFVCWFILVIAQPILIAKKRFKLHRRLGRASYFLAPILVATILILVNEKVQREISVSKNDAAITALIGLLDVISFTAFYLIAMVNKKNIRWHVAFIIAATLIVLNPGMARLMNQFSEGLGLISAVFLPFIVSIAIFVVEKIKLKRDILKSPYFLFFICWLLEIVILVVVPQSTFWVKLVSDFANK